MIVQAKAVLVEGDWMMDAEMAAQVGRTAPVTFDGHEIGETKIVACYRDPGDDLKVWVDLEMTVTWPRGENPG